MVGITVVAAAVQILDKALGQLNAARERAQGSKDADLKDQISRLYDTMLSLKEVLLRVTEENSDLRHKIEQLENAQKEKPELRQVGDVNYYFVGEKGPFCQVCFDGEGKLVALSPVGPTLSGGGLRRSCPLCKETFYEKRMR